MEQRLPGRGTKKSSGPHPQLHHSATKNYQKIQEAGVTLLTLAMAGDGDKEDRLRTKAFDVDEVI